MTAAALHAADALLPTGWARDVLIEWDAAGCITGVRPHSGWSQTSGVARAVRPVLPRLPTGPYAMGAQGIITRRG